MKYKATLNELVELLDVEKKDEETSKETLERLLAELDELRANKE